MKILEGYRTIGLIVISLALAVLSRKHLINPDSGLSASNLWDALVTNWEAIAGVITSVMAIVMKLRAPQPGPLAPK